MCFPLSFGGDENVGKIMKIYLAALTCAVLIVSNSYGDDQTPSAEIPGTPPQMQEMPQKPETAVPPRKRSTAPAGPSRQRARNTPAEFPSNNITPGKIKAFLSKPQKEESYIILNFDNADLKDVINTIGSITNENFILSPGLDARVTIHSAKKIPVSQVMSVFESVLEANGMALVRSGEFLKLVSGTAAKQKPLEVKTGRDAEAVPDIDRPVTQIVPVEFVPVAEISTILTPMLSQFGSIIPNPRNNLLIINDLQSNIVRLFKVLKEIDVNAFKNTRMSFFKPKYSDVTALSNELTEVLNALNLTREGIALVPIERINSLVVFSSSPTLLSTVEGWVRKLDEEVSSGQNIFVYPVQNVKADTVADILNTLYEAGGGVTKQRVTAQSKTAKKPTTTRRRTTSPSRQAGSTGSRIEIITFEPTNSLVILAPPGVYREMVKTIKKIDIYPREVLIEAVIAEVSLTNNDEYGIQWSVLQNLDIEGRDFNSLIEGKFGDPAPDLFAAAPTLASGPGGLSYVLFKPDRLTALIRALASESKVNILSSPRLLVRDQQEASIEVGSDIPTASSTTSTTTTDTLTQNIEYRTVGIKLKIKPTISEEKTVVLDIEQEVSSKGENQQVGQAGNTFPSFNTTKTKTSIVIPDQKGIVIGGIIQEENNTGYQGIPLLSNVPLLGHLFRYNVDTKTKKELIIIITPYVVTNETEGEKFSQQYMNQLRELKTFLEEKDSAIDITRKEAETPQPQ